MCDPDDSFVICFFDIDRLPFQSQSVPGSQFVRMSRDERKSRRVCQRTASHAVVFRRVAFHLLPCGEEVKGGIVGGVGRRKKAVGARRLPLLPLVTQ